MKKLLLTYRLELAILILIPVIISVNLFRNHFVFGGAEEGIPFYNIQNTISLYSNIWVNQVPGYPLVFEVGKIPFLTILLGISKLVPSVSFISCTYVLILMTVGILGMFGLALTLFDKLEHKCAISFWSAIFYLLNPFSMSQVWGRHLSMQMYPFALIPGFLAFLIFGLKNKKFIYAILAIILSFIFAGAFNHPSYVITLFFLVLFYFSISLLTHKGNRIYTILYAVGSGVLFVIANSLWILPYLAQLREPNDFIGNKENLSILMGLSQYFPLSTILTLKQKYYFNLVEAFGHQYQTPLFLGIALLLPFILLVGFTKVKSLQRTTLFFIVCGFFASLFISAGGNRPFGPIVLWFINHFSILEIYRNAYEKFGLILTLFYSFIFGLGFYGVSSFLTRRKLFAIFPLLIFVVFILYLMPLWQGTVFQEPTATNQPPQYYSDFRQWADTNTDTGRILLTPIMNGDATNQEWANKTYGGIDISPFILPNGTITREIPGLPGNEYTHLLRTHMQQQDVSQILKSLRVKYIVNRADMVVNPTFQKHVDYLTKETAIPTNATTIPCSVTPHTNLTSNLFYECKTASTDLSNIKFIHIGLDTNTKVAVEARLLDKNGLRTRWDGKTENNYVIDQNVHELILPIGIETELPEKFSYKDVVAIEVSFFPIEGYINPTVNLNFIKTDLGKTVQLHTYNNLTDFGKLQVYESKAPLFNEIRLSQQIKIVPNLESFFNTYKADDQTTYIVDIKGKAPTQMSQNTLLSSAKITDTLYEVSVKDTSPAYILFSQNMNSSWKVIPKKVVDDYQILQSQFLPEKIHFTADGYANLWSVNGSTDYTIVYLPAVYVRFGEKISLLTVSLLSLYSIIYFAILKKNTIQ